jgi:uncharacterized protein (TIGR03435 family)
MNDSNRKKASLFLFPCLFALSIQAAQDNRPKAGDSPPLLQATMLLQAPAGTHLDLKSLRGKVVVLEFWATWCGPCVAAIPHLNELADKFKDKPVQFVAITAEDAATIKPFLVKRPIHAWVALDSDKSMNHAYGVSAIPHTVILDRKGRIAAITHPSGLMEQHINDLLAGKTIALKEPSYSQDTVENKDPNAQPPLFQVLVRPSTYTNSSCSSGGSRLNARGYTVWSILPIAFGESSCRILTNSLLPETKYDFTITQPQGTGEEVAFLLQQALKSAFGLVGTKETNEVEVLLLQAKAPKAKGLVVSPTPGGVFHSGPGDIGGMDISMSGMAAALESNLKKPVFDETGLTNHYDVTLKWEQKTPDQPNPEGLTQALRDSLGLDLVPAKRAVRMVRVRQTKATQTAP